MHDRLYFLLPLTLILDLLILVVAIPLKVISLLFLKLFQLQLQVVVNGNLDFLQAGDHVQLWLYILKSN